MSGHTATPWYIVGDDEVVSGVPCIVIASGEMGTASYKSICEVQSTLNEVTDEFSISEVDRKNAALIIAGCNSHAELVKALEDVIAWRDSANFDCINIGPVTQGVFDRARAALATLTARKVG